MGKAAVNMPTSARARAREMFETRLHPDDQRRHRLDHG
jgi:hypothetical protein